MEFSSNSCKKKKTQTKKSYEIFLTLTKNLFFNWIDMGIILL